jgi:3-hydroxyacyl-CoA dehydrogenase
VIRYELRGRVALITIDNPPVNALGPGVLEDLEAAVARAAADTGAAAIVVVGAGETFVAGADINVFRTLATRDAALERTELFHRQLYTIESASKPVVAAIHGNALGGGLELAMACHYRVAAAGARVGQPEVLLGLIPGAGGTQRLPRLGGVERALDMCIEGKPITAADAHAAGIVDRVVAESSAGGGSIRDRLIAEALAFASGLGEAGAVRRTRDLTDALGDPTAGAAACAERRARLSRSPTPVRAPYAAIDAIHAACTVSFDKGSAIERELFADCLVSRESRALVHLFFAEREAGKVPGVPKGTTAREIARAAVVGAGTMGGGIAMVYANAGIPVLLREADEEALAKGVARVRANYDASVSKGRMPAAARDRAMALITPTTSYDGFDAADIIVEAVFEDLELKKTVFGELAQVTRADCVLASNTSTLDIDALAAASGRAPLVIGHHFFSPANVMKLLEIVRGRGTAPETIAASLKLARRLGKVAAVVGNAFGFVANRMLLPYLREAYLMLEEGAPVPQIDRAMTSFGMPVGPFAMEDITGLDVGARIRRQLGATPTAARWPESQVADRLVALGRHGQKTGAGWYLYEPGSRTPVPDSSIDAFAEEAAAARGLRRRRIAEQEICERLTTALINEGARVLEEGIATRAGDIDVIYCYGFGFPRYRGGPMFYGDTIGVATLFARISEYRERAGDHWQAAPLLQRLAAEGRTLSG